MKYASSYEYKASHETPLQRFPNGTITRTFLDVNGKGDLQMFVAKQRYDLSQSSSNATPAKFSFFKKTKSGFFVQSDTVIENSEMGCIHPRKAIVADFNNDSKPDVFVACHGWDKEPFPGEKNKIVLSQSSGFYRIFDVADDVGFFHGASAIDLNNDGYLDVVVTNSNATPSIQAFLNDGKGGFSQVNNYIPFLLKGRLNYYSVEFMDIDGDGALDLLVGGHEWEGADTSVYLNPGNNDYSKAKRMILPRVDKYGVVLDFMTTITDSVRSLWILRTSGGDGTFYEGIGLQKIVWPGLDSKLVLQTRTKEWVPWIFDVKINADQYVVSDNLTVCIELSTTTVSDTCLKFTGGSVSTKNLWSAFEGQSIIFNSLFETKVSNASAGMPDKIKFNLRGWLESVDGEVDSLELVISEPLGRILPEEIKKCSGALTKIYDDGLHRIFLTFLKNGNHFMSYDKKCLIANLPKSQSSQLNFMLENMKLIAEQLVASGEIRNVKHIGVQKFLTKIAAGEVSVN